MGCPTLPTIPAVLISNIFLFPSFNCHSRKEWAKNNYSGASEIRKWWGLEANRFITAGNSSPQEILWQILPPWVSQQNQATSAESQGIWWKRELRAKCFSIYSISNCNWKWLFVGGWDVWFGWWDGEYFNTGHNTWSHIWCDEDHEFSQQSAKQQAHHSTRCHLCQQTTRNWRVWNCSAGSLDQWHWKSE